MWILHSCSAAHVCNQILTVGSLTTGTEEEDYVCDRDLNPEVSITFVSIHTYIEKLEYYKKKYLPLISESETLTLFRFMSLFLQISNCRKLEYRQNVFMP